VITILVYLFVGYVLYRAKWADGFLPAEHDAERERTRRIGRRRVAPLPDEGGDEP
jgi:hypothetical protein